MLKLSIFSLLSLQLVYVISVETLKELFLLSFYAIFKLQTLAFLESYMLKNRDQGIPVKNFSKNFRELLKETLVFRAHSVVGSFLVNLTL